MNGGKILQDTGSSCMGVYRSCGPAAWGDCKSAVRNELPIAIGFGEGGNLLRNYLLQLIRSLSLTN